MSQFENVWYYRIPQQEEPSVLDADVCIYGSNPGGLAAAIQARKLGLRTIIVDPGRYMGGMTCSGLGATDSGKKSSIGGLAKEFYRRVGKHYNTDQMWTFEPHVAQKIFSDWVGEADMDIEFRQPLAHVDVENGRIQSITSETGRRYRANIFIDASYEGDLLAKAGVSYAVGREGNTKYNETLNGIHFGHPNHNFYSWVDPYVVEGKPDSGLLWGVTDEEPGYQGQPDQCVQAYNFRICLTNVPENRMPFPQPPSYNPDQFTLLARYLRSGIWDALRLNKQMPNGKTDLNNFGAVSTDLIGRNHEWPEGSNETREQIYQEHFNYNLGLLYFLINDDRVPEHVRQEASQWGLCQDEFIETGGWPFQLYVREGRRMVSDVVMTERHCRGLETVSDPIGLASYQMDSHNCRRIVIDGRCINEGNVEVGLQTPYPISYGSIVPGIEECTNLLVPGCLSSSHIAYGSIRMEPVFMILGQSAAIAASIALEGDGVVQHVEYGSLRSRLVAAGQVLEHA